MGLDIRFIRRKKIVCPRCGEIVYHVDEDCVDGGGRGWYPLLESLGYYTEESEWYGKDMVLTVEQVEEVYNFIMQHDLYGSVGTRELLAVALFEKEDVVVNADW